MSSVPLRLGVLASGSGTNLQSILDACAAKTINAEVALVISNKRTAGALVKASSVGVDSQVISHKAYTTRKSFEEALVQSFRLRNIQLVVLAGFMRLLTSHFLNAFRNRVINIHPSLLPAFPGVNAQQQAFDYGVKFSGCTVHFVDEGMDTGPIIAQAVVPVLDTDDVETLQKRILVEEHKLLPQVIQWIADEQIM